jgi:hypothetical protein
MNITARTTGEYGITKVALTPSAVPVQTYSMIFVEVKEVVASSDWGTGVKATVAAVGEVRVGGVMV